MLQYCIVLLVDLVLGLTMDMLHVDLVLGLTIDMFHLYLVVGLTIDMVHVDLVLGLTMDMVHGTNSTLCGKHTKPDELKMKDEQHRPRKCHPFFIMCTVFGSL